MIKKTIKSKDLDGNPLEETFWFNLNTAEVAKMELGQKGGLSGYLTAIVEANDGATIVNVFEEILMKAFGLRREDNKGLEKSPEISKSFMETDAYSVLFMELVTDADASAEFIKGIVPVEMQEDMNKPVLPVGMLPKEEVHLESVGTDPHGMGTVEKVSAAVETAKTSSMTLDEMKAAIRRAEENK